MPLPGFRGAPVDWLIVGLGHPGAEYTATPHSIGFEVAARLRARWDLGKPKSRYRALVAEGRAQIPAGDGTFIAPRVAILEPQTYMNDSGKSGGAARGEVKREPDHVLAL